jgi:hypothetical protein
VNMKSGLINFHFMQDCLCSMCGLISHTIPYNWSYQVRGGLPCLLLLSE